MSMSKHTKGRHLGWAVLLTMGVIAVFVTAGLLVQPATAAPQPKAALSNDDCLSCHAKKNTITLFSGETLDITIDQAAFLSSTHGSNGVTCVTCHSDISGFPHPTRTMETQRDVKLKYYQSCQLCHTKEYNKTLDSVHQKALAAGNKNAAVCADCHNPHTQKPMEQLPPNEIPKICARCHSAIYETYEKSVHGKALDEEHNPDVPTCIDCHGVHNIDDPLTSEFRLKSPTQMCGRCHTDKKIMDKYGISTRVLDTYVSDFHGTTITLFEQQAPDQAVNKPVCFDCHGIHDIKRTDDPEKGLQVKSNLIKTCQKCHPTATVDTFADSWLGHYIPDAQKYPWVYFVNLFYTVLIPGVLGGMAIFIATDIFRRVYERIFGHGGSH